MAVSLTNDFVAINLSMLVLVLVPLLFNLIFFSFSQTLRMIQLRMQGT